MWSPACLKLFLLFVGNGWAAAGMLRVLGSIRDSPFADALLDEQTDLGSWVDEILTAAWSFQVSSCHGAVCYGREPAGASQCPNQMARHNVQFRRRRMRCMRSSLALSRMLNFHRLHVLSSLATIDRDEHDSRC